MTREEASAANDTCSGDDLESNSTLEDEYAPEFSSVVGPHYVCNSRFCGLRSLSFVGPRQDGINFYYTVYFLLFHSVKLFEYYGPKWWSVSE